MEGRSFGIHATVLEPGDTATAFTQQRVMVLPPDSPYAKKALLAVKKMEHDEINGASPEKVANCIAYRGPTQPAHPQCSGNRLSSAIGSEEIPALPLGGDSHPVDVHR